jgi:lipopolysaccharide transport protein LptA
MFPLITLCLFISLPGYADSPTQSVALPSATPILIEADQFHLDLESEQAVWQGNVQATQGNYTFRTSSLTLQLEQIQPQSQTAAGVNTTTGQHSDQNAYQLSANQVSYDLEAGQILGTGNSELRRGFESIRAEDIIYQVKQQRVQAKPAANGRVHVQFFSQPGQSFFPAGN